MRSATRSSRKVSSTRAASSRVAPTKAPSTRGLGRDTRERILDAAERRFASQGIHATSLRQITADAGANLAAVNYHFSSKGALTEEVFLRRLRPLNQKRLARLTRAERAAGRSGPSLEEILHALFDPTVRLWEEHPDFMKLLGRLQFEPDRDLHTFCLSQFDEIIRRFEVAVVRALPEIPARELYWRMHFIFGAMVHTWTCGTDIEEISRGVCVVRPYQRTVSRLIAFGVAGLKAPYGARNRKRQRHREVGGSP